MNRSSVPREAWLREHEVLQGSWFVAGLWPLVLGSLFGAMGGVEIHVPLICLAILSLPAGILTIPLLYYLHVKSGYLLLGESSHFSGVSLVCLAWSVCVLTAFLQWRAFGLSNTVAVSKKAASIGSLVGVSLIVLSGWLLTILIDNRVI